MTPSQRHRLFALYFIECCQRNIPEKFIGKERQVSAAGFMAVEYLKAGPLHPKVQKALLMCGLQQADTGNGPTRIFELRPSARSGIFKHRVTLYALIQAKRFMRPYMFKNTYNYFFNTLDPKRGA